MNVAAVITNHNTWALSLRCIECLERLSEGRLQEVVVVDDFSSEREPVALPAIRILRNAAHRGYVASVNIGIAATGADIVVLLDSDARPLSDIVQPCLDAFSADPKLGALGFRTVDKQGSATGSSEEEPDALGLLLGQRLEALRRRVLTPSPKRQRLFYSCALALRRTAFDSVNGFDAGFDFLDADLDFSKRLYNAGWSQREEARLLALHEGGGSTQTAARRVVRFHRNRWRYLAKHSALPPRVPFKLALAARHGIEYALLRLLAFRRLPAATLAEELSGRKTLLRTVWTGYGNE